MRQEHYLKHLIDNDSLLQHNHIEVELIDFLIFWLHHLHDSLYLFL
jgi:hypothetical protein